MVLSNAKVMGSILKESIVIKQSDKTWLNANAPNVVNYQAVYISKQIVAIYRPMLYNYITYLDVHQHIKWKSLNNNL